MQLERQGRSTVAVLLLCCLTTWTGSKQ